MIVKCIVCNKEIKAVPSDIKKGFKKFCSRKCMGAWNSQNRIQENSNGWRGGKIEVQCINCGKEIYITQHRHDLGEAKYCSKSCKGKWQSNNKIGANSNRWNGGITPIIVALRNGIRYTQWRQQVYIRDGFLCKHCGDAGGGNLNAHHKKHFSILLKEAIDYMPLLPAIEAAIIYLPLWDINNGITLCEKCHKEAHKKAVV